MSEFEMSCPHCGTVLAAQDDWIGMDVACPSCGKQFKITKDMASGTAEPQPENGTFTFVCPSCSTVTELPVSLLGQKYECQMCFEEHVAQATTERQCPFCGQTVKYHATICKFCKADLTKMPPEAGNETEPAQEGKFIFICSECDMVAELPLSAKGQEYTCKACCETTVAEPAEERKCPYCGKKIKIKASICKFCKKNVPAVLNSSKQGDTTSFQLLKNKLTAISFSKLINSLDRRGTSNDQKSKHDFLYCIKNFLCNLNKKILYIIIAFVLLISIVIFGISFLLGRSSVKSGSSAKSERSYIPTESKISVVVTVKKGGYYSWDSCWTYNCEYKLYANDQLIASRNSTSMSVTFNVKVEKGASLRAEMLPKNGYGGIAQTLEGPNWNKTVTASYSGETLTIECGY